MQPAPNNSKWKSLADKNTRNIQLANILTAKNVICFYFAGNNIVDRQLNTGEVSPLVHDSNDYCYIIFAGQTIPIAVDNIQIPHVVASQDPPVPPNTNNFVLPNRAIGTPRKSVQISTPSIETTSVASTTPRSRSVTPSRVSQSVTTSSPSELPKMQIPSITLSKEKLSCNNFLSEEFCFWLLQRGRAISDIVRLRQEIYRDIATRFFGGNSNDLAVITIEILYEIVHQYEIRFFEQRIQPSLRNAVPRLYFRGTIASVNPGCCDMHKIDGVDAIVIGISNAIFNLHLFVNGKRTEMYAGIDCADLLAALLVVIEQQLINLIAIRFAPEARKPYLKAEALTKTLSTVVFGHSVQENDFGKFKTHDPIRYRERVRGSLSIGGIINVLMPNAVGVVSFRVVTLHTQSNGRLFTASRYNPLTLQTDALVETIDVDSVVL